MDKRRRRRALLAVLLVCVSLLAIQAVTAGPAADGPSDITPADPPGSTNTPETGTPGGPTATPAPRTEGHTLISVQSYGGFKNNGRAIIVGNQGVVWEYDPPNSRVFDAEMLANGNVLVAVAEKVPAEDCPEEHLERQDSHCVENRIVELDYDTKDVVWEYSWYDAFIHWHEVHDVDRLENGETAIIDMGNNRAFTVDENGTITWSWDAEKHLGEGSDFREEYGGPSQEGPESDWTHMNDIDRLDNGNFQLSIRNFDTVIEVDPETDEIVEVIGSPGDHDVMKKQHNPQRLGDTLLVADSDNNRAVELDVETGEVVWEYGGPGLLNWPRDADRLPNGNTLIADTYNNRVLEVTPSGDVVWSYTVTAVEDGKEKGGLVYQVDRLYAEGEWLSEEQYRLEKDQPTANPNGTDTPGGTDSPTPTDRPTGRTTGGGEIAAFLFRLEAWAAFYFPAWMKLPELATMTVGLFAGLGLVVDEGLARWRER